MKVPADERPEVSGSRKLRKLPVHVSLPPALAMDGGVGGEGSKGPQRLVDQQRRDEGDVTLSQVAEGGCIVGSVLHCRRFLGRVPRGTHRASEAARAFGGICLSGCRASEQPKRRQEWKSQ